MMVAYTVYIRPVHVVHWAHGPNNVISVDFKERHFEFRVNRVFGVIIGFFIQKNMDLETKILDLLVLSLDSLST